MPVTTDNSAEKKTLTAEQVAQQQLDAQDAIDLLRGQIDSLDAAIVNLIAERKKLSARVQTARMNAGGTRVQLGRERVIMDTYRAALGADGPALAESVLQVCRGRR